MYVLEVSLKLKCMCVCVFSHVYPMYVHETLNNTRMYVWRESVCVCVMHGSDEPLCPGLEQEALIES